MRSLTGMACRGFGICCCLIAPRGTTNDAKAERLGLVYYIVRVRSERCDDYSINKQYLLTRDASRLLTATDDALIDGKQLRAPQGRARR